MAICTFSTVKIGFQRVHYKVNEGDGCVEVCAVILSGYLGHQDKISFRFTTASDTAVGVFVNPPHTFCLLFGLPLKMHSESVNCYVCVPCGMKLLGLKYTKIIRLASFPVLHKSKHSKTGGRESMRMRLTTSSVFQTGGCSLLFLT